MKKIFQRLAIFSVVLALSACNFPFSGGDPTPTALSQEDIMSTAVASAMEAIMATQAAQPTPTVPPTAMPVPTLAPTIPAVPTGTVSASGATTTGATPCNAAVFVSETIPDDTLFSMGEAFTKTWTFQNTGTCTWNTNYKLVFVSGDSMEGAPYVNLAQEVAPGTQITVSVPLRAPYTEGTFTGYWALQGENGVNFLTNNSVKISTATDTFRVTSVETTIKDRSSFACDGSPYTFNVSITTSTAGTVTYKLKYFKNGTGSSNLLKETALQTIKFNSGSTKTQDYSFSPAIEESGDYYVQVYIESPNNQTFGSYKFHITCD